MKKIINKINNYLDNHFGKWVFAVICASILALFINVMIVTIRPIDTKDIYTEYDCLSNRIDSLQFEIHKLKVDIEVLQNKGLREYAEELAGIRNK